MSILNSNFGAELFLSELTLQCKLFSEAMKELESAAEHWLKLHRGIDDGLNFPPWKIVGDCTVCLSSMAAVRRILHPDKKDTARHARAAILLIILGNPSLTNIASAKVRNSWEHFDERLDEVLAKRNLYSHPVTELQVSRYPLPNNTVVLRRFDPVTCAIHFAGDNIDLRQAATEMNSLQQSVNSAYSILKTTSFKL